MSASITLSALLGPVYLILGFSVIVHPKRWEKSLDEWRGSHIHKTLWALVELVVALALILKHNVWEWSPWTLITLTGWGMLLESIFYLFGSEKHINMIVKHFNHPLSIKVMGVVSVLIGGYLSYLAYFG